MRRSQHGHVDTNLGHSPAWVDHRSKAFNTSVVTKRPWYTRAWINESGHVSRGTRTSLGAGHLCGSCGRLGGVGARIRARALEPVPECERRVLAVSGSDTLGHSGVAAKHARREAVSSGRPASTVLTADRKRHESRRGFESPLPDSPPAPWLSRRRFGTPVLDFGQGFSCRRSCLERRRRDRTFGAVTPLQPRSGTLVWSPPPPPVATRPGDAPARRPGHRMRR